MNGKTNLVEIPCILEGDCLEILTKAGIHFMRDDHSCKNERERMERGLPWLQRVRLPDEWSMRPFPRGLYDHKRRQRTDMFYKSGLMGYDTQADMRALPRFRIRCEAYGENRRRVFTVRDGRDDGPIVFTSSEYFQHSLEERDAAGIGTLDVIRFIQEDEAESNRVIGECQRWLDVRYPSWKDNAAYWD